MSCCTFTGWIIISVYVFVIYVPLKAEANLYCLTCTDAVKPRDCGEMAICGSHEQCFTDSYVTNFGTIRYNLGCRDKEQCSPRTSSLIGRRSVSGLLVCSQCCSDSNICNNQGCGEKGYGDRALRGPVCASCQTQEYEDDCNKVTVCGRDEMCSLRKLYNPTTQETRFKTECIGRSSCLDDVHQLNSLLHYVNVIGRRELVEVDAGGSCVMRCCDDDLCNINCVNKPALSSSSTSPSSASVTETTVHTTLPFTLASPTSTTAVTTLPKSTSAFTPLPTTSSSITTTTTAATIFTLPKSTSAFTPPPASSSSITTTTTTATILTLPKSTSATTTSDKPSKTPPSVFTTSVQTTVQPNSSSGTPIPDPCLDNPCAFGTCSPYGNSYRCTCVLGYFGRNCTEMISLYPPTSSTEAAANSKTTTSSYVIPTVQATKPATTLSSTTTTTTVPSPSTPIKTSTPISTTTSAPTSTTTPALTSTTTPASTSTTTPAPTSTTTPAITYTTTPAPISTTTPATTSITGSHFSLPITDPCLNNPCLGGTCSVYKNGVDYECSCFTGFWGRNCSNTMQTQTAATVLTTSPSSPPNPCSSNPCMNGMCVHTQSNSFFCNCAAGYGGILCNHKAACRDLHVGDAVTRGPDWSYGDVGTGIGYVTEVTADGWVKVQWENTVENSYRNGNNGSCEVWPIVGLTITPTATLQTTKTTTAYVDPCAPNPCGNGTCITLDVSQQRVNCKCAVGFIGSKCDQNWTCMRELAIPEIVHEPDMDADIIGDFCPQLEIGDSVIKGPDWHYKDQDHGTIGKVVANPNSGYVMVEWKDNSANYYRYDATGPCDVWPVKVSLLAHDCEAHKRFCDAHCGQGRYFDTPDMCIYCICKSSAH